jgi:F420-0:gamma-glutamyl ligase
MQNKAYRKGHFGTEIGWRRVYKVESAAQTADIFQTALLVTSLNFSAVRQFSSQERLKEFR